MSWSSTEKDGEVRSVASQALRTRPDDLQLTTTILFISTVGKELPEIFKRFWVMLTLMTLALLAIIAFATPWMPLRLQVSGASI